MSYILLYWHNKFHNIFIIIQVSIFYRLKSIGKKRQSTNIATLVCSSGTVSTVATVLFFFFNIYISWHIYCYTDLTNFTSQLLRCQLLIGRKKKNMIPQLKINVLWKYCKTCCYHNIFTIVEISVSYRSNKKNAKSTTFSH